MLFQDWDTDDGMAYKLGYPQVSARPKPYRLADVTPTPAAEPVPVTDLKYYCKILTTKEDPVIESMGKTARLLCEKYMAKAITKKVLVMIFDGWAPGMFDIPYPPLIAVDSIKAYDLNDNESTVATSVYSVETGAHPGRVFLKNGQVWPAQLRPYNSMRVQFQCGLADATTADDAIKQAIKEQVADMYQNRGDSDKSGKLCPNALILLQPLRLVKM